MLTFAELRGPDSSRLCFSPAASPHCSGHWWARCNCSYFSSPRHTWPVWTYRIVLAVPVGFGSNPVHGLNHLFALFVLLNIDHFGLAILCDVPKDHRFGPCRSEGLMDRTGVMTSHVSMCVGAQDTHLLRRSVRAPRCLHQVPLSNVLSPGCTCS